MVKSVALAPKPDSEAESEAASAESDSNRTQVASREPSLRSSDPIEDLIPGSETPAANADIKSKSQPRESVADGGNLGLKGRSGREPAVANDATKGNEPTKSRETDPEIVPESLAIEDQATPRLNPESAREQVASTTAEPSSQATAEQHAEQNRQTAQPGAAARTGTEAASENGASPREADEVKPRNTQSLNSAPENPDTQAHLPATEEPLQNEREKAALLSALGSTDSSQSRPSSPMSPVDRQRSLRFEGQRGQNSESNRLRLKITDELVAVGGDGEGGASSETMNIRELLKSIDRQLTVAEKTLFELNQNPNTSDVSQRSQDADVYLEKSELIVAKLRNESKDTKYAFVGLQMLDISRTNLRPARDRVFALIGDPGSNPARNILEALHYTSSARELLAALTKQFDKVARERELGETLEELGKIYKVYVENMQGVLRAAQANRNPLKRKMAFIEVDEAYLDRYTQVLEMRREIMAAAGRMLADDPRLMGKYMDLIKRRRNNLRTELRKLHERQGDALREVTGWLNVDELQRPDVWIDVASMRLWAARDLVKDASQLEARTLSQLPLNVEPGAAAPAQVIHRAKQVALHARQSSIKANELNKQSLDNEPAKRELQTLSDELNHELRELIASLEELAFEHEDDDVDDFVNKRLVESRSLAEKATAWAEVVPAVRRGRYHGLAAIDQQRVAIETERLRVGMGTIQDDIDGLFQPDDVPAEVTSIISELLSVMENITFHQAAATYQLDSNNLRPANLQQTMADEGFVRAEELFDKMRRTVVEILDEREVDDPDIANLQDPTLDEFLERLEREPNLEQLLNIPNRPTNLRVIQDWMLWESQSGRGEGAAQQAAAEAMMRAEKLTKRMNDEEKKKREQTAEDREVTEQEMQKFAQAEDMEEEMEKMLRAIEQRMKDPATGDEQREQLQKKAAMLAQMMKEARTGNLNRRKWQEMVEADEMKAMIAALAAGEPIPDSQWNRVLSTLDNGLWQVRGRTPPEDYRKPIEQYQDLIRELLNE